MKNWLIKKLGGFTYDHLQIAVGRGQKASYAQGFKDGEYKGYQEGLKKGKELKKRAPGWLKKEIHRKLDIMFPGKEFNKARYRWLRSHSMTSSHMSKMTYTELQAVNKLLSQTLKENK